jgi:pimeloyl-ACP methyl ester carboxylesterase
MNVTSVDPGTEPNPVSPLGSGYVDPPTTLLDTTLSSNGDESRIIGQLRNAAASQNANTILQTVAALYAAQWANSQYPLDQQTQIFATSMTQLAVTGSNAFAVWNGNSDMTSFLTGLGVDLTDAATMATQITNDFNSALQLIRSPNGRDSQPRPIPWVAVSGEDDSPDFIVNVDTVPYPQFHLAITVNNSQGQPITLNIRYLLASNSIPGNTTTPFIPAGDEVILFIHGEGSRAEEGSSLIPVLLSLGANEGRSFTVIAFDLPSMGYSTMVPHLSVAPEPQDTTQILGQTLGQQLGDFPLLEFTESAITTFVDQLIQTLPFSNPIVAVIGGSLGGHMALRLLASQPSWLQRVVAWSPASVEDHATNSWVPLPFYLFTNPQLSGNMSAPESVGPTLAVDSRANFFQAIFDNATFPFNAGLIDPLIVAAAISLVAPAIYYAGFFGALLVAALTAEALQAFQYIPPQATMWDWDGWPGKTVAVLESRLDRREVYCETFRQWHWRICEELVNFDFTALSADFSKPLLLMVGEKDAYPCVNFFGNVTSFAQNLQLPGYAFTVQNTGHSIHDEHPTFLAQKIIDFTAPAFNGASLPPPDGVQFVPGTLAVATNANGCIEIFAVNQNDGNVWHAYQQTPGGSWDWASDGQSWHALSPPPAGVSFIPNPSPYGPLQSPAVVQRDGALEVFAISSAGAPYRITQGGIGGTGGWSAWMAMAVPPGEIWSLSASVSWNLTVVVYATKQGVFYDVLVWVGPDEIEAWTGPQPGPTNAGVNIVRLNTPVTAYLGGGLFMVGMALGNPETFYCSRWQGLSWSDWVVACSGPGPATATLQDFRIGYHVNDGINIFGVTRFTGHLLDALQDTFGSVGGWLNFNTLNDGPFQYGVLDVGLLPVWQNYSQHSSYESPNFQYQCIFLTDTAGSILQVIPLRCNDFNDEAEDPSGPFVIDNNSDGHFGAISTLAVGVNQDSRLEVFALEPNNQCYHWWQRTPDAQLQNLLWGFSS